MWTVEIDERALAEVNGLPALLKARLALYIRKIERSGLQSLEPGAARQTDGKLWELRLKADVGIARALYFTLHPKRVCIVSAFVKKSQKLPANEKSKAEARLKEKIAAEPPKK